MDNSLTEAKNISKQKKSNINYNFNYKCHNEINYNALHKF